MQMDGWCRNVLIKHVFLRKSFILLLFMLAVALHVLIVINFSWKLVSILHLCSFFLGKLQCGGCQTPSPLLFSTTNHNNHEFTPPDTQPSLFTFFILQRDDSIWILFSFLNSSVLSNPSTQRYPVPNENILLPKIKQAHHCTSIVQNNLYAKLLYPAVRLGSNGFSHVFMSCHLLLIYFVYIPRPVFW